MDYAAPDPSRYPLTIRLFGPFSAHVEGQPLPTLRSRTEKWLLALLVLHSPRPAERDWLAQILWPFPDTLQSRANANLRRSLYEIRKALGTQAVRLHSPNAHTVALDLADAHADVLAFDAAIARGTSASLEQAVSLYQGPLLSECTHNWVLGEREPRQLAYQKALEALSARAMAVKDYAAAVDRLRLAIAADPLREECQRLLMDALAQSGDVHAALQVYQEFGRWLQRDDPRAAPSSETSALYQKLRAQARRTTAISSIPVPATPATPPPRNLPRPLNELVGREEDVVEVATRLRRARLLTLTGSGGVGKTRLAIAVAEEVVDEYADGAWFVDLAGLSDPLLVPQGVASTLGVREEPGRPLAETLAGYLGSKRLLLVLDNCEHVLAACARLAEGLLLQGPTLRILATSREAMGINGENLWRVPSLRSPDLERLPEEKTAWLEAISAYAAVQMFVERAEAVQKTFQLTQANALAVAQICSHLDGIPLALELASARLRALSVEQIARRLDDRFSLLSRGSRTARPRHQTLRALIDWSYDLLSEPEKWLFERLSVFAGGWTLEAAERVCTGDGIEAWEVLELLTGLVEKSLVNIEEQDGESRYRLLETLRQYAGERLCERGEEADVRAQHRGYFVGWIEQVEPHLRGPDQKQWLERVETEHDNLRTAQEACKTTDDGAEEALRLCGALAHFWEVHGHPSEGRMRLTQALAAASGRTAARAKALKGAGRMADRFNDYTAARPLLEEALAIYRELGDRAGEAACLNYLGTVKLALTSDKALARALHEESLAICRELGDRRGIAYALNNLGVLTLGDGDLDRTRALHEESLALRQSLGDKGSIAMSLHNLGVVADYQSDYAAASAFLENALAIHRELGNTLSCANLHCDLGFVVSHRGDYATARLHLEESLGLFRNMVQKRGVAWALSRLGGTVQMQGDYAAARARFEEALAIYREVGDEPSMAWILSQLASVARDEGNDTEMRVLYAEAVRIARNTGSMGTIGVSLAGLAEFALRQRQAGRAVRLWAISEALCETLGQHFQVWERERLARHLAEARRAMGEEAYLSAWTEGRALPWEQAIDYALQADRGMNKRLGRQGRNMA